MKIYLLPFLQVMGPFLRGQHQTSSFTEAHLNGKIPYSKILNQDGICALF